ncbi:MAG: tRNA pseudouridine(55) synthase TruB [Pseudomonadota bacterium]
MGRRKTGLPISGWLNFHKPLEMTSTQAVGKTRWLLNARKAGHGGTLDPLATGVLPIAFGEATKALPYLVDARKVYRFTVGWGTQTDTDDLEGRVMATSDMRPTKHDVAAVTQKFTGTIEQLPPAFSALKVDGKRAYELARSGETVALKARTIKIFALDVLDVSEQGATFDAEVSKGTYIRALGRDMALALGTVGHITKLERRRVGPFSLENAITLATLEDFAHKPDLLLPLETVLDDIPALAISAEDVARIRQGQALTYDGAGDGEVLLTHAGHSVSIAAIEDGRIQPRRVFQVEGMKNP